jgi:hypothetical protein
MKHPTNPGKVLHTTTSSSVYTMPLPSRGYLFKRKIKDIVVFVLVWSMLLAIIGILAFTLYIEVVN